MARAHHTHQDIAGPTRCAVDTAVNTDRPVRPRTGARGRRSNTDRDVMATVDGPPLLARPADIAADTAAGVPAAPDVAERMLTLVYRVVRQVGYTPDAGYRLCHGLLRRHQLWTRSPVTTDQVRPDGGRVIRTRLVAAVHAELEPQVDPVLLGEALRAAVLWDEVSLLPTRQRMVVSWSLVQHRTVAQMTDLTGWTADQVTRLLRAGLRTVTVCGAMDIAEDPAR